MLRVRFATAAALVLLAAAPTLASDGDADGAPAATPADLEGSAAPALPAAAAAEPEPVFACDPLFDDDCSEADAALGEAHFPDPWERYNRGVLKFNNGLDRYLLGPLTWAYQKVLPDPVERAVVRALQNLDTPAMLVNDGLQLEWADGAVTLGRFLVNTTIGIGGLFDPAESMGLERHRCDFGQTLTLAGIGSGPYMILPLFGPSTVRDGTGVLVDVAMSPLLYLIGPLSFELWRQTGVGIAVRADRARDIDTLKKESVDFYAAMRNAYYQNRQAEIWTGREHRRPSTAAPVPSPSGLESEQPEPVAYPAS